MPVQGTWNILGYNLPDYGVTEWLRSLVGKTPSAQVTTTFNNPLVIQRQDEAKKTIQQGGGGGGSWGKTLNLPPSNSPPSSPPPSSPPPSSPPPSSPPPSSPPPQNINDLVRGKNVGDIINIGGRNYRVVDPGKGIIEPNWDNTWEDQRIAEMENRVRGQIESGYNDFIKKLDELAGLYPQWQQEDIQRLETSRQTGLQGLETAKQSGIEKLGLAREQALQQEQQAKGDIMSQLRQLLKASQMKAGLMGAGWSSATQEVLPAALGKQASQAGAQVARGTISNLNQIAQKEVDVRNTFELAKNELEQDFNAKMDEIAQRYRQLKTWIETEKANAGLKKAQALAALDENLMNNMINEANMYKQMYLQQQQALRQWVMNRLAQLQDYKIQLGQMGNFVPEELAFQPIRGIGDLVGRPGGSWTEDIFGSMLSKAQRKKELLGNSLK